MKKSVALILTVVLLLAAAATCLAAHEHAWHQANVSYEYLSDGQRWVPAGSCDNLKYSGHYHFYSRYRKNHHVRHPERQGKVPHGQITSPGITRFRL